MAFVAFSLDFVEYSSLDLPTQNSEEPDLLASAFNIAINLKPLKRLVNL